jgi:hypothetical protein
VGAGPYLDFETDLHDLSGRDTETSRRQIGVKVHRGEQGFSPRRHTCGSPARNRHHTPKIVCDISWIDAVQFRHTAGKI